MKRDGSTEGVRKLFEAVSATLWDKILGGARSLKTAFARFGQCISASKQASDLYQVRMRLMKHMTRFCTTIYVQFHLGVHGTVPSCEFCVRFFPR